MKAKITHISMITIIAGILTIVGYLLPRVTTPWDGNLTITLGNNNSVHVHNCSETTSETTCSMCLTRQRANNDPVNPDPIVVSPSGRVVRPPSERVVVSPSGRVVMSPSERVVRSPR